MRKYVHVHISARNAHTFFTGFSSSSSSSSSDSDFFEAFFFLGADFFFFRDAGDEAASSPPPAAYNWNYFSIIKHIQQAGRISLTKANIMIYALKTVVENARV